MATHTQTGHACEEQCIGNYCALIADDEAKKRKRVRITILNERRSRREERKKREMK